VRVDVIFGGHQMTAADIHGRVVLVIDVLRASTTVAVALSNGARAVIPFESSDEVINRAKQFERSDVLLAGERKMRAIPGFDLGNSPLEYTRDTVEGKTVLLTTTNGTVALVGVQGARDVIVASYVNYSAVAAMIRAAARGAADVAIVCAGRDRQFALEDAACAGRFARTVNRRLASVRLNDAAQACTLIDKRYGDGLDRLFEDSEHGRALAEAGFSADLAVCGEVDAHPVIPIYQDRQITKLGPDRER
jgi:2-phosphosulfolactate phosphatase